MAGAEDVGRIVEHYAFRIQPRGLFARVLRTAYGHSREEIALALEQIFATAQFEIERLDEARQALSDFRSTKADFSDALIGRVNRSLGAQRTVTFDRDLKAVETFRLL